MEDDTTKNVPDATKAHLRDIEAQNRKVMDARTEWDDARANAAAYKKEHDAAVEELTQLIAEGKPAPLFDA